MSLLKHNNFTDKYKYLQLIVQKYIFTDCGCIIVRVDNAEWTTTEERVYMDFLFFCEYVRVSLASQKKRKKEYPSKCVITTSTPGVYNNEWADAAEKGERSRTPGPLLQQHNPHFMQ